MLERVMLDPKELSQKIYEDIVDYMIAELKESPRAENVNAFIELGSVIDKDFLDMSKYHIKNLNKRVYEYVINLPLCIQKIMAKDIDYNDFNVEIGYVNDLIADEIVRRVIDEAKYAYGIFLFNQGLIECTCNGGGCPSLQKFEVYDDTYYGDDTDEDNERYLKRSNNEDNFMGTHYRYTCIMCEKSTPLYDDIDKAKRAWNRMNNEDAV